MQWLTFAAPLCQVVVSDHGMTDGGNHGGSSYEETDSLALFIGHNVERSDCSPYEQNEVLQVKSIVYLRPSFY
jgi:hypothetical protein